MRTTQLNQQYDWLNEKMIMIMILDMGHALLYISGLYSRKQQCGITSLEVLTIN